MDISRENLLALGRDELEVVARDACPPEQFYELQDNLDSTPDHDLIELILSCQSGNPE